MALFAHPTSLHPPIIIISKFNSMSLRRSLVRFPRAEYRPLTGYEEVFGYQGSKRNAYLFAVISFSTLGASFILLTKVATEQSATWAVESRQPRFLDERERDAILLAKQEDERRRAANKVSQWPLQ